MPIYVASQIIKQMLNKSDSAASAPGVLMLGLAFKENCPDVRNTKVVDIVAELVDLWCSG